jgi:hypothetical protein
MTYWEKRERRHFLSVAFFSNIAATALGNKNFLPGLVLNLLLILH